MRRFAQLFAGRTDCYGSYVVSETRSDGKQKGKGRTHRGDVTENHWTNHLTGKVMLGIVPILPNGTCSWFALDIDDYKIDHKALIAKVEEYEIPAIVCRSKSGGAHLYCFINGFVTAEAARKLIYKWVDLLKPVFHFTDFDVFPKQAETEEAAFGNWIIPPYFGGDNTGRYAFGLNAERLTLAEFEQYANAKAITPKEFEMCLAKRVAPVENIWKDAPPCVEYFATEGMREGGRNSLLAHMCVFYKRVDQNNWKEMVEQFNQHYCHPPISHTELADIFKNHRKKKYEYYCKHEPMKSHCDQTACLARKYGIGSGAKYETFEITALTVIKSTPRVFIFEIDGSKVQMEADSISNPSRFRQAIMAGTGKFVKRFDADDLDKMLEPVFATKKTEEDAPDDVSIEGQVRYVIHEWAKNMIPRCRSREDISKGLPFWEKDAREIWFRGEDFVKAYRQIYRKDIETRKIWTELREMGCMSKLLRVKNVPMRVWIYPLNEEQIWFEEPKHGQF